MSKFHLVKGSIYTVTPFFQDYVIALRSVGIAKKMNPENFLDLASGLSQGKTSKQTRPLLAEVYVVQFRRGENTMYFKKSHSEANNVFQNADYLKNNLKIILRSKDYMRTIPVKPNPGIVQSRKGEIIEKLCPLMPADRREFWDRL